MARDHGDDHRAAARAFRDEGSFADAGDRYTLAAFEYLGGTTFESPHRATADGLHALLMAATCDRVAALPERARSRSLQGILVAGDMASREVDATPSDRVEGARRGAWFEFVGDFRTVADVDGVDTAYEGAKRLYRGADDPDASTLGHEHERLYDYFIAVAGGADGDVDHRDLRGEMPVSERVDYKHDRLGAFIDALTARARWVAPTAP